MPAPKSNLNSLRHGRFSRRSGVGAFHGLAAKRPELKPVEERLRRLERELLASVTKLRGQVGPADEACISNALRRLFVELLATARIAEGKLTAQEELDAAKTAADAAEQRAKITAALLPVESRGDAVARILAEQRRTRTATTDGSTATDETDSREHDLETK